MNCRLAVILMAWVAILGCQRATDTTISSDQVKKELREAGTAVGQYARQQRDEYLAQMQTELDRLDSQLADWKQRLQDAQADARPKLEKQIQNLEKQRENVRKHYEEVKKDSGEAWKELRIGLDRAYGELRQSFDQAKEHFNR